jgi:hypothetical protein
MLVTLLVEIINCPIQLFMSAAGIYFIIFNIHSIQF